MMLRIVESKLGTDGVTAKLEGQMRDQWVHEVRAYCERCMEDGHLLTLDVQDVSFLDRDAVTLLRQLADKGVRVVNRTPFLAELLRPDTTGQ
jgi:anti-anti-sigma regulatory factor